MKKKILKSLALVLFVLLGVIGSSVVVMASEDVTIDGNDYVIDLDNHTAILMTWFDPNPDVVVPSVVSYEGEDYRVTEIAAYAFCVNNHIINGNIRDNIRSITLSEGITEIQSGAFSRCGSLEKVNLPFTVTYISNWVFEDCKSLKAIILPDKLRALGDRVFVGCDSLETIYYPPNMKQEMGDAQLPDDIVEIKYESNEDGTVNLSFVNIPEGVMDVTIVNKIGDKEVGSVTLPEGTNVTLACDSHEWKFDMENHFYDCGLCGEAAEDTHEYENGTTACECGYVPVVITAQPSGLDLSYGMTKGKSLSVIAEGTLGEEEILYQWYENEKIIDGAETYSYSLPEKMAAGSYSYYCEISSRDYVVKTDVVTVTVGACKHAWDNGVITKQATYSEKGVRTYTCTVCGETKTEDIPKIEEVPEIEDTSKTEENDDAGNQTVNTASHKKGTKHQDDKKYATYKITKAGLKNGTVEYVKPVKKSKSTVTIPATVKIDGVTYKVTSVAKNAFKGNRHIKCLTIGKNVKKIGAKAFYGCKKLKTVTIKTTKLTVKGVGSKAFKGIKSTATIKVPKKKFKTYKSMLKKKGVGKKVKFKK